MGYLERSYTDLVAPVIHHPGSQSGGNRDSTADDVLVLLERLHPAWHRQAACNGMTRQFFPERGEANSGRLRMVCAGCEVRAECLDYAVENNVKAGVWGGCTEKERRQIRRARGLVRRYADD